MDEIFSLAEKFVFINAACYPAARLLPHGENAHCTVRPGVWWEKILQSVMFNYPDVMYCFLVEYFYLDVVKKKSVFFRYLVILMVLQGAYNWILQLCQY